MSFGQSEVSGRSDIEPEVSSTNRMFGRTICEVMMRIGSSRASARQGGTTSSATQTIAMSGLKT
jgi:hypothetical protein